MTFDTNVPNANQSPGIFPTQNNTNFVRLKALISGDHVFNDTVQANDGIHKQTTMVNRLDPVSVPVGANSMAYGKAAVDSVNEYWFYDNVTPQQLNWRELSGTVTVSNMLATVAAIPKNCFGYIFLFKDLLIQAGTIFSDGSVVNGYSYVESYASSTVINNLLTLGNGINASALDLQVKTNVTTANGTPTAGDWGYRIFYRKHS